MRLSGSWPVLISCAAYEMGDPKPNDPKTYPPGPSVIGYLEVQFHL